MFRVTGALEVIQCNPYLVDVTHTQYPQLGQELDLKSLQQRWYQSGLFFRDLEQKPCHSLLKTMQLSVRRIT